MKIPLIRTDLKQHALSQAYELFPQAEEKELQRIAYYLLRYQENEFAVLGNRMHEVADEYRLAFDELDRERGK